MQNIMTKFGIALLAAFAISSAQALPITGTIQFTAAGTFVDADGNATGTAADATGVDFTYATAYYGAPIGVNPTGDIYDMVAPNGFPWYMQVFDFNLADAPPLPEWSVDAVVNGNSGQLVFDILTGGVVDLGTPGGNFDLAGTGMFRFICDNQAACDDGATALDPALHTFEDTVGTWSISNTANGDLVVGINVPAPATIGVLGIALLGLGVIRRRKSVA